MKFYSHLTEAALLRRSYKFLAEIALPNQQDHLMIRCPNLHDLTGCDILGTRVWYSNAVGYHCLPTWELAEIDGGHLVCVNDEILKPLVIEAIKNQRIPSLANYELIYSEQSQDPQKYQHLFLKKGEHCCVLGLEPVTLADAQGNGFFPEVSGNGKENLLKLIQLAQENHRAILLFCSLNTSIDCIKPASHIDPEYILLLKEAVNLGVELMAYSTNINLESIELSKPLPVVFSRDTIFP